MPYCPQCFVEYVEGTSECEDCGVGLVEGSPPLAAADVEHREDTANVKMVRVRTFSGPTALLEADLARNLLRTQGIPCVLPGEFSAETLPGVDVVQLLVREEDGERAAEILSSYFDSPGPIPCD